MMENIGYLDLHSHILPGIDDGSKDWDMTEGMLQAAYCQGVRTIVATPHNYQEDVKQDNGRIRDFSSIHSLLLLIARLLQFFLLSFGQVYLSPSFDSPIS